MEFKDNVLQLNNKNLAPLLKSGGVFFFEKIRRKNSMNYEEKNLD